MNARTIATKPAAEIAAFSVNCFHFRFIFMSFCFPRILLFSVWVVYIYILLFEVCVLAWTSELHIHLIRLAPPYVATSLSICKSQEESLFTNSKRFRLSYSEKLVVIFGSVLLPKTDFQDVWISDVLVSCLLVFSRMIMYTFIFTRVLCCLSWPWESTVLLFLLLSVTYAILKDLYISEKHVSIFVLAAPSTTFQTRIAVIASIPTLRWAGKHT